MTFYEAALRILESEGHPLHIHDLTQKSIAQNLLSHVGKTPELTMLSRLAAMARRKADRRVMVTAKDTFALSEWSLPEDAEALAVTGIPEPNPEEDLPPLRPVERHPEPRSDNIRSAGRQERRHRRGEEDERGGRKRRYPPIPEVVFEILSEAGALTARALVDKARERELGSNELSPELLLTALLEDNQRRIDAGRRPQFILSKETGEVSLERAGSPTEAAPLELQAAFAEALGIPLEGGRPVLRGSHLGRSDGGAEAGTLFAQAKTTVKDARRAMARGLRKRLMDLEPSTFEKAVVKLLHHAGFRELKVAKRSKDGPLMTARRREGSLELRFAVRVLLSDRVDRRDVHDLRKDLGHYSAQVGLLISTGELRPDAKSEAVSSGALVMVWCADALAERFLEHKTGVHVTQVELFELDETFFETARQDGVASQKRREERHRERDEQRSSEEREPIHAAPEGGGQGQAEETGLTPAADEQGPEGDDDAEGGDDELEAAHAFVGGTATEGAARPEGEGGDRKRRRRRRRGRRGRGPRPEGAPGQSAQGGTGGESTQASGEHAPPPPPPPPNEGPQST